MDTARVRFACLWVSVVARNLADGCLCLLALLAPAGLPFDNLVLAGYPIIALFLGPFLLLAPLNGCLSKRWPRRGVLVGSACLTLLTVGLLAIPGPSWLLCLGLTAVGSALYSSARWAMLPAAASDTHVPLPRLVGWTELGTLTAIAGSIALGWSVSSAARHTAVLLLLGLNSLCFLAAIGARFPTDPLRREPLLSALHGFFRDTSRILGSRQTRGYLLGLAGCQALVMVSMGILALPMLLGGLEQGEPGPSSPGGQAPAIFGLGAVLGCGTASLQGNPRRSPGLVPLGTTALLCTLLTLAARWHPLAGPPRSDCLFLGFFGGLVLVPLRAAYLAAVPADARGNGMALMNALVCLPIIALALLLLWNAHAQPVPTPTMLLLVLAGLAGLAAVLAWIWLFGRAIEVLAELVLVPMYRIRAHGPGKDHLPLQGPLIVVANHSSYLDPFWVGKLFPGQLRPLMSSAFYDLPGIHWLIVHVVQAIRVPLGEARRHLETPGDNPQAGPAQRLPELREAIAALRQGDCLLIFPESMLRRKEEELLRLFGQGIWHILRELPDTPVLPVWIEGGWGSWASYCNGPPMKNKTLDWRRTIDVVFGEPGPLPEAVLAHQRTTRAYLMEACLECRRHLGLAVPATAAASADQESE